MKNDIINHPAHYTDGSIEVIDYIEDKQLGYHLGNAIKYISRAGKKDPTKKAEDLRKAVWYLERYIEKLEPVDEPKAEPEKPERPDPKPEQKTKKKDKGQKQIDDGKIKALREGGWTLAEIADEMSLSAMTVRAHLKKMGVK